MANASLFNQFIRPAKSMAEYGAEYDRADENKLQLAAKRMQMQQAERGIADDQAVRGIVSQYGNDKNALVKALYGGGYATQAQGIEKSMLDQLKGQSDLDTAAAGRRKTEQEIESKKLEDAKRRIDLAGQALGFVKDNPTAENAIRAADFLGQNGVWDQAAVQKAIGEVQANPTPEAVRALAEQAFRAALDAKEQLPKIMQQNRGGTQAIVSANPVTGQVADVQTAQVTESEAQRLARERAAADAAAGRGVQLKIAGMADARAREGLKLQGERLAYDKTKPQGAAAKPMPAAALKMQDEDLNAIGTFAGIDADLAGIEKQIADGKLELGPVNNVTGQVRNLVGASNENSRNLATFKAKLENMRNSVLLLNKGVQTEGDAQRAMNEMIANINDPEVVKQRLKEIRALNQRAVMLKKNNVDMVRRNYNQEDMDYSRYENQPPATNLNASPKPAGGAPAKVASDADYNALPSGATFIGPDGKTRRKP